MAEFFAENWMAIVWAAAGMIVCTMGGLLSLMPDPERPQRFVPVYLMALVIFVIGLAIIVRCQQLAEWSKDLLAQTN